MLHVHFSRRPRFASPVSRSVTSSLWIDSALFQTILSRASSEWVRYVLVAPGLLGVPTSAQGWLEIDFSSYLLTCLIICWLGSANGCRNTHRRARVISTPSSYAGGPGFESRSGGRLSWQAVCNFPRFTETNTGTVLVIVHDRFLSQPFQFIVVINLAFDLYSAGGRFESWSRHRLFCLRVVMFFLSPSKLVL
jgi:hypothetical protein